MPLTHLLFTITTINLALIISPEPSCSVSRTCVQLASDGFATSLSEDTLCRVLASDKLNVEDELTLYHAVAIRAAQNQFR